MRLSHLGALLCAVIGLGLGGCAKIKEELKPVKLEPISPQYWVKQIWQRDAGKGQDARYARLQPVIENNVIYTLDLRGHVTAWALPKGKQLWRTHLKAPVSGGLGMGGDLGLVGTMNGQVIALDLKTGTEKWRANVSSEVVSSPQSDGETVIAQAIDGRVYGLSAQDGHVLWDYDHPTPVLSLRSNADPLVKSTNSYVAFDNGQLLNFDTLTGQLKWSARIGQPKGKTDLERIIDMDTTPLERGSFLIAAGFNSRLAALIKSNGRVAWSQDLSTSRQLAADDSVVYVVDVDSHVKAFDLNTGALLWENKSLHRRDLSSPQIWGDLLVSIDRYGFLHGLSLKDGQLQARKRLGSKAVLAQPMVWQNHLYVLTKKGDLLALDTVALKDGASFWDLPTGRQTGAVPTKFTGEVTLP